MEIPQKISSSREVTPPWMQGAKEINKEEMLVVHMNDGELEGLDNLQGGPSLDPETGIREYSALASIIEIPEIKALFHHVYNEIEQHGDISPDLKKIYASAKEYSLPYKEAPEEKHNPLKAIEHTGRKGDTKLALIPLNLAFLLIELRGKPSINPKTGLLEFGNVVRQVGKAIKKVASHVFSNPLRTIGTIAPLLLAGPLGLPALASPLAIGVGNAAGSLASGQSLGKSIGTGLTVGGLGYGAQGVGQAMGLGNATPYTSGFFGGAPNALAQGLGSTGIPGFSSAPAHSAWGPLQPHFPLNPSQALTKTLTPSGGWAQTLKNMMSSPTAQMLKDIAPYALPVGTLAMTALGSQKHYKQENKKYKEEQKRLEEEEARHEEEKERMGFYEPWKEPPARKRRVNPRYNRHHVSDLEHKYGIFSEPAFLDEDERRYARGGSIKSYSKGTLVRGPGKGQDDKIKTSVPEGSYIIDASTTSMFGDGSTKAGSDILREFENHIKNKFPKEITQRVNHHLQMKNTPQLPVWLSEGEYKIDPTTVTLLGKGSNDKGASLLKEMVIKLRKHKISNGSGLPPKAKAPVYYMKG